MTSGGTTFTLVTPYESVNVTMKLIGKFNVYNVLAATAGLVSGVKLETIIAVIKELAGFQGVLKLLMEDKIIQLLLITHIRRIV